MKTTTENLQDASVGDLAHDGIARATATPSVTSTATPKGYPAGQQNSAEAVEGLRAIFLVLDKSYDRNKPIGQAMIMAKTVEAIQNKPPLKARIVQAIEEGTTATIEIALDHPAARPVIAAIKGFMTA